MADLTLNTFSGGVVTETLETAAAGGDALQNYTGKEFFIIDNAHATNARTITFNSIEACDFGSDHNLAIVVAALTRRLVKLPAPASRWKNSGAVGITYSDSGADITIGAFKWPE